MLDNVELIMYMKFQRLLITGCRDMDKNIKNAWKMGIFPLFCKNRALSLLYPYSALTSCKKLEKTNEQSNEQIFKDGPMDRPRTDGQGWFTREPLQRTWGPKCLRRNHFLILSLGNWPWMTLRIHINNWSWKFQVDILKISDNWYYVKC